MAAGEGRRVGQKRSQPGGKPGPTGPKRRKASKQAHSPEALAKKVYHAKKALVRASQKWKAKNVASTKRRLKQAAVAHAALVAKGEEGLEVPAKALANVRKKLAAATADTGLMKELDLELQWSRWVFKVAGGIDCSLFISSAHLERCQEVAPPSDDAAEERRKELLLQKLECAASIQEPLRALKIELGRLKGAVIDVERQKAREAQAEGNDSSREAMSEGEDSVSAASDGGSGTSVSEEQAASGPASASEGDSFSSEAVVDSSSSSDDSGDANQRGFVVAVPDFGEEFSSDGDEAVIPRDAAMHADLSDRSSSSSSADSSATSSSSTDGDESSSSDARDGGRDSSSSTSEMGEGGFEIQVPFEVKADDHEELASIAREEMVLAVIDSEGSSDDGGTQSSTDGAPQPKLEREKPSKDTAAKPKKSSRSDGHAPVSSLFVASLSGDVVSKRQKEPKSPAASKEEKAKKKAKKNRKGQRARQKEWEEKFGTRAKHLKNVKKQAHASDHATPAPDLHPSWASRKAAAQKISLGGFKGKKTVFGGDAPARSPARAAATEEKKGPKKQDFTKVHPSWASRQKKESIGIGTAKGKRITFDD